MITICQRATIMDDNSSSFDKKYYAFAAFVNIMVTRQQVRYSYGISAAGGVDALLMALRYDAYSDDRLCMC